MTVPRDLPDSGNVERSTRRFCDIQTCKSRTEKNQYMEAQTGFKFNGRNYPKGTGMPGYWVYVFFLVHMLAFGLSGFFMSYMDNAPEIGFLYMHGGFAILVYVIFYVAISVSVYAAIYLLE